MNKLITICILSMVITAGGDTFDTYDQFSVTLPTGWVWMPRNVLIQYAKTIDKLAPDTPSQFYDYGFQYRNSDDWFTYPYILIQVKNVGRIPTGEMARYRKVRSGMEEGLDQVREGYSSVITEAVAGEPEFDYERKILWTSMSMDLQDKGQVRALIAVKLTEKGLIQLNGYATSETFDEYEPVFREAFATLEVDEAIRYKPQITDNAPVIGNINLGKVLIVCIQGAIAGGVLWIVYALVRKAIRRVMKRA